MLKKDDFNYFSTYLIAAEAARRGVKVKKMFTSGPLVKHSVVEMNYRGRYEILYGQRTADISAPAYWVTKNKQATKVVLKRAGINVSRGDIFNKHQIKEAVTLAKNIGFPVVIKPYDGIQGKRVFVGLADERAVKRAIREVAKHHFYFLVEEQFIGDEYRILATKEKFVAAINRIPANVTGDGHHSITELIAIKNSDPRRGTGHKKSLVRITVDDTVVAMLKSQRLTLRSRPAAGTVVYLRQNSNLSTGGDSIDATDVVHPAVKKLAVKIIRAIPGLGYAGIDFLTTDITKPPTKHNYIVIELNDSPMISMHHIPYQGQSHDAASAIVDLLFPETVKKKK